MEWKDSNITLPLPKRNELTSLIEQNGVRMEVPAKKVFLKPGDTLNGVYYIAEGRTRHFMCAPDGAEKLLYTLSAGWFYGETPCVLHDSTGLFSKTEKPCSLSFTCGGSTAIFSLLHSSIYAAILPADASTLVSSAAIYSFG